MGQLKRERQGKEDGESAKNVFSNRDVKVGENE
jgi:hypothetical protein